MIFVVTKTSEPKYREEIEINSLEKLLKFTKELESKSITLLTYNLDIKLNWVIQINE